MAGEERSVKVKIENVRKVYDTRNGEMVALNGVDLDIMENEFIIRMIFIFRIHMRTKVKLVLRHQMRIKFLKVINLIWTLEKRNICTG